MGKKMVEIKIPHIEMAEVFYFCKWISYNITTATKI